MKSFWVLGFVSLLLSGCARGFDLNWTDVVFDGEVAVGGPPLFVPLTLIQSAAAKGAGNKVRPRFLFMMHHGLVLCYLFTVILYCCEQLDLR